MCEKCDTIRKKIEENGGDSEYGNWVADGQAVCEDCYALKGGGVVNLTALGRGWVSELVAEGFDAHQAELFAA